MNSSNLLKMMVLKEELLKKLVTITLITLKVLLYLNIKLLMPIFMKLF